MAQYISWGAWTSSSVIGGSVTTGNTLSATAIDINDTVGALISVELTFGATKNFPMYLYILKDVDGTPETLDNSHIWAIEGLATATAYRTVPISTLDFEIFTLLLDNTTGSTVTSINLKYKTATLVSV